jgi:hypothetical protein
LVHTNYTWGYFIHGANGPYSANPNLTTAGIAFFNASGQLLSQPIQAALKTWKKCAPAVNPVLGASGTSISSGVHVDIGANLATVSDADVTDIASDLKGTISWGDSSPSSPATISGGNGNFTVHGSHTYPGPGTYSATVSIAPALGTHYPTANTTITVS